MQIYQDYILGQKSQENVEKKKTNLRKNLTDPMKSSLSWLAHQNCNDMFLLSKWNQSKYEDYAIERDYGTDYGICCWYTPQLNYTEVAEDMNRKNIAEPDWGTWFHKIPKGAKTGIDHGFSILLDIETFDYSDFNEASEGLKIALVHHLDMPIMRQKGFHIAPGTENQIAVTPTLLSTSDNAMSRYCYIIQSHSVRWENIDWRIMALSIVLP